MGQISLPRLEKINKSMSWEGGLLYHKERWAGPKLYILYKLITRYFFFKRARNTWVIWKFKNNNITSNFINSKKKKKILDIPQHKTYLVVGRYIYQQRDRYNTLVLYSSRETRRQGVIKTYRRLKKLKSKTNVTNKRNI